jgi:hypothetical protein
MILHRLFFAFFVTVQPGMQQSADSATVKRAFVDQHNLWCVAT